MTVIGNLFDTGAREEWQDRASCASVGDDFWFPEQGGVVREAKRICSGCPVRDECLGYALEHNEAFGIWGGFTERERRRLKRRSRVPGRSSLCGSLRGADWHYRRDELPCIQCREAVRADVRGRRAGEPAL